MTRWRPRRAAPARAAPAAVSLLTLTLVLCLGQAPRRALRGHAATPPLAGLQPAACATAHTLPPTPRLLPPPPYREALQGRPNARRVGRPVALGCAAVPLGCLCCLPQALGRLGPATRINGSASNPDKGGARCRAVCQRCRRCQRCVSAALAGPLGCSADVDAFPTDMR